MPLWSSQHRKPSSRRISRRRVLALNMISLPLADFRHLSHIGTDGHTDSFGDLSFLKEGHNLLQQSSKSEQNLFLACGAPPKPPRSNMDEPGRCSPVWEHEPTNQMQKSSSLPLLDEDENAGSADSTQTQTQVDTGFTFSLDLGPSILDDVLQVMDKQHTLTHKTEHFNQRSRPGNVLM